MLHDSNRFSALFPLFALSSPRRLSFLMLAAQTRRRLFKLRRRFRSGALGSLCSAPLTSPACTSYTSASIFPLFRPLQRLPWAPRPLCYGRPSRPRMEEAPDEAAARAGAAPWAGDPAGGGSRRGKGAARAP
eukprot:scaffold1557_cov246-Pinguiococcus_pyrenoidosus.AAC.24